MTHLTMTFREGTGTSEQIVNKVAAELAREYIALVPITKRGHTYQPGESIWLAPSTAINFIALGEIKESQ